MYFLIMQHSYLTTNVPPPTDPDTDIVRMIRYSSDPIRHVRDVEPQTDPPTCEKAVSWMQATWPTTERTFAQHRTLEHNDMRKDPYLKEFFQDFASTCTMQMAALSLVALIAERVNSSLACS